MLHRQFEKRMVICRGCGEIKPHYAKSLCLKCYKKMSYRLGKKKKRLEYNKKMKIWRMFNKANVRAINHRYYEKHKKKQ